MPSETITFWIAVWGAILSTIVVIWDFVKWSHSGAKLRITTKPNTYYPDSDIVDNQVFKPSIHIEIANVGTLPTTLISVQSTITSKVKRDWFRKTKSMVKTTWKGQNIKWHQNDKFPFLLKTGEIWSGRLEQESLINTRDQDMFKYSNIILSVVASHKKKPIEHIILKPNQDYVGRSASPNSDNRINN